jgi:uncharacterized OB-fold protein
MQGYTCKCGKRRKVTERKISNMHLLKTYKASYKSDVKFDGKKDEQYAFIESGKATLNVTN